MGSNVSNLTPKPYFSTSIEYHKQIKRANRLTTSTLDLGFFFFPLPFTVLTISLIRFIMIHLARLKRTKSNLTITGESDSSIQNNDPSCLLRTPEEEKRIIKELYRQTNSKKEGDTFYLLSTIWLTKWDEYTGVEEDDLSVYNWPSTPPPRPGQINNPHLVLGGEGHDIKLVKNLTEGHDYVVVSEQVWNKFHDWYKGGPAIPRKVILQGTIHKTLEIESYLCRHSTFGMHLVLSSAEPSKSPGPPPVNEFSVGDSCSSYWGIWPNSPVAVPSDIEDGFEIGETEKEDRGGGGGEGLCGLENLGNTCFMNSALQCLMHTSPLVEYFLKDYIEEINKQNPIGMKGELAIAFGDLLREIWSPSPKSIAPCLFKTTLARFAPQFSGYNQHDSHELLAFLLDGLHEDLNRVKVKPYVELTDANGRSDDDIGKEYWEMHKARNNSVIVDVCQGQYKSTLVCPVCKHVSVTFDPFMYLSLPLPSKATRAMTVTVFHSNGSDIPNQYTVTVLKHGLVKDLVQALSTACCLRSDESLLLVEVYNSGIFKFYESPFEALAEIKDFEFLVAYRIPKNYQECIMLEIIHRTKKRKFEIGIPLVTCLTRVPQNASDIQSAVSMVLKPLLTMDNMEVDQLPELSFGELKERSQRVWLNWSDRELDMYKLSYLQNLPKVYSTEYAWKKTREEEEKIKLSACLEAFLKEEPLGPEDMWFCPTYKEHKLANKKLDLWKLPEILVFHLKRFSYSRYLKNKLDTFVDFPTQNLDLQDYVKSNDVDPQSYVYELYAVSNHYGGLGGGHYTAYAKLEEDKWYDFNDSLVSTVSEDEIKTEAAYVLFYRRLPAKVPDLSLSQTSSGSSPSDIHDEYRQQYWAYCCGRSNGYKQRDYTIKGTHKNPTTPDTSELPYIKGMPF